MFKKKYFIIFMMILIVIIGGWVYLNNSYQPSKDNQQYLDRDNIKEFEKYYLFKSVEKGDTALIFYPGGKVEETAYAPLCSMLSGANYSVFLVKMPFNLAVFDKNRANDIIKEYEDDYKNWYISGHSLGGAMAASYLSDHIDLFNGIIFLASYPPEEVDLSQTELKVLSITSTEDLIINDKKLEETKKNLPADTEFNIIKGGNHADFGNYGPQKGDGENKIGKEKQWEITVNYIINFITKGGKSNEY